MKCGILGCERAGEHYYLDTDYLYIKMFETIPITVSFIVYCM
jgi:hypothetical protein